MVLTKPEMMKALEVMLRQKFAGEPEVEVVPGRWSVRVRIAHGSKPPTSFRVELVEEKLT